MTLFTKAVAAGADDGSFDVVGSGYSNTGTNFVVGDSSGSIYNKSVFMRFTAVTIPQGATISAASLSIPATGGSVTPLQTVHIRAEAADNPAAVSSRADGIARTKTTAQTSWSGMTNISTGSYTSADFTAVIQEVVNRAGWASGNAMQMFLSSDSASFGTAWQIAFANFNSATSSPATLSVTYSTGTDYTPSPSDAEGITDSAADALDSVRSQADPVGLTDASALGVERTPADPVGATDAAARVLDGVRVSADPLGLADAVAAVAAALQSPSDPAGITDSVAGVLAVTRQVDDPVGATDAASAGFDLTRQVTDSVGIADFATGGSTYTADLIDWVGILDADEEQALDFGETFPEPVGIADATTAQATTARTQPDPVGIADAASAAADRAQASSDPVGLTDAISVVMSRIVTVADFLTLTDNPGIDFVSAPPDIVVTFGDVEPISDAAAWAASNDRALSDGLALTDSAVALLERSLAATATEAVGITDGALSALDQLMATADALALTDSVEAVLGSLADIPLMRITRYRLRSDTVTARLRADTIHGGIQ